VNRRKLQRFFDKRLLQPILGFLKQGISPKKLALTLALGTVCGLFPIVGTTTLLCLGVALLFRLNMAIIQVINYFMAPIQLVLFIPFVQLGAWLFETNPFPYSLEQILEMIATDPLHSLEMFWVAALLGITTWALFALPVFVLLYFLSYYFFSRVIISPDAPPHVSAEEVN
jgi:uncharacterized protein (DUF2062 family)